MKQSDELCMTYDIVERVNDSDVFLLLSYDGGGCRGSHSI
jgi:hypothetical protein